MREAKLQVLRFSPLIAAIFIAAANTAYDRHWFGSQELHAYTVEAIGTPTGQAASDQGLDAVLAQVEAAQVRLVNGQPDAFKALWSRADDITLTGGLGGVISRGWTQVSQRLDWVAGQYREGTRTHQEISRYVGQDLAYVVLRETIRFKSPGDGRAMTQELRVTQVFRREGGQWRIVHRHADSQTTKG